jgi:hypothetical protein
VVNHFGEAGLEAGLLRYLTTSPRLARGLAEFLTGEPSADGSQPLSAEGLQTALCQLARSIASERPVIWIVEDVTFGSDSHDLLLALRIATISACS